MRTRSFVPTFLLALSACGSTLRPLASPQQPRQHFVLQREFRLGMFDFGRIAGDPDELSNAIPAMLLTELRDGGRFAIYEGGNIRSDNPGNELLNEGNASQYVDGYLSGTLTARSDQQACFDFRMSNAVSHEVLYARSVCVAINGERQVDRGAVKRIAEEIARAVKQVGNGKVTSAEGRIVFCDKGAEAGVSRGMVAYIVGTADSVRDPKIHNEVRENTGVDPAGLARIATPVVIGEMYVVSVEKRYSVGLLYKGRYVMPGDTVFFK